MLKIKSMFLFSYKFVSMQVVFVVTKYLEYFVVIRLEEGLGFVLGIDLGILDVAVLNVAVLNVAV